MATLNRFPLLGLWAEEAARRAGYRKDEAESLGHAYAVLYAIRAQRHPKTEHEGKKPETAAKKRAKAEQVLFGGDKIDVMRDSKGHLRGLVGGEKPQGPASFRSNIERKYPPEYYTKLQKAFRRVFKQLPPRLLENGVVYDLYDQWKISCGVGRLVDLDSLLEWCEEYAAAKA